MQSMMQKATHILSRGRAGYTLVELMIVVVIIGLLAALATPAIVRSVRRSQARDSAVALANVFRTARDQAMRRGEVVLMRVQPGSANNTITMHAAPRVNALDPSSPLVRSCQTIVDFATALTEPHDAIPALSWSAARLLHPSMRIVTEEDLAGPFDLCFAPDGRIYHGDTTPISIGGAECDAGLVMIIADASAPPASLAYPNGSFVCPSGAAEADKFSVATFQAQRTASIEVDIARDAARAWRIEVGHNGKVVAEP